MTVIEIGMTMRATSEIATSARYLEDLGYDYISVGEHVAFYVPTPNSLISLAGAAAVTSRVRLMTGVLLLPLYPPVLAAKMTACLDVCSDGRLSVGVGIGGEYRAEFEACGVPYAERGARADEALEILRRCWSGELVSYSGRFAAFEDIRIAPMPLQRPHPPIWIAGRKEAALRRVARYANGWLPYMVTPEMIVVGRQRLDLECRAVDRDPASVETGLYIFACCHENRETAYEMAKTQLGRQYGQDFTSKARRYALVGTPDDCLGRLSQYLDAGVSTVIVSSACSDDYVTTNQLLLAQSVVPVLRELDPSST